MDRLRDELVKKLIFISAIAIAVVGLSIIAVRVFGVTDSILQYAGTLRSGDPNFIARYYLLLLLIYFLVYAMTVALCQPLTALMAALGGWLFGLWSLPVAVLSVTAGST